MVEHTPGPWFVSLGSDVGQRTYIRGRHQGTESAIAQVLKRSEQMANARLIAAAPDLLAELEALVEAEWMISPDWSGAAERTAVLEKARAVAAQARGSQLDALKGEEKE